MIKVLVADDHAVVCKGLCQIFETTSDIRIEDEAKRLKEFYDGVDARGELEVADTL